MFNIDNSWYLWRGQHGFYEAPGRSLLDGFLRANRPVDFVIQIRSDWAYLQPVGSEIPQQGWKIHLSSLSADCKQVLTVAGGLCLKENIPFKFIKSLEELRNRNSRNTSIRSYGKFITIYPNSDEQFNAIVEYLLKHLNERNSPRILSDLEIGKGIFARFGVFHSQIKESETGKRFEYLVSPNGSIQAQSSVSYYHKPDWVTVPDALLDAHRLFERKLKKASRLPFKDIRIVRSTSKGVNFTASYCGRQVFVKEAQRRVGFSSPSLDSAEHLIREFHTLKSLKGISNLIQPIDLLEVEDSVFEILPYIPEPPLRSLISQYHTKSLTCDFDSAVTRNFYKHILTSCQDLVNTVQEIHSRGIYHGDISTSNILYSDGATTLIDFEGAGTEDTKPWLETSGFGECSMNGFEKDWFSILCVIVEALGERPALASQGGNYLKRQLILSSRRYDEIGLLIATIKTLCPTVFHQPNEFNLAKTLNSSKMQRGLLGSHAENVGPHDPEFEGSGIAFGVPGVVAVRNSDCPTKIHHLNQNLSLTIKDTTLPNGLSGLICSGLVAEPPVLDEFTHHFTTALDNRDVSTILDCLPAVCRILNNDSADVPKERADKLLERTVESLNRCHYRNNHPAGLLYGASGQAMSLIDVFRIFPDARITSLVKNLIRQDFRKLVLTSGNQLGAQYQNRVLPYLGIGSAGVLWAEIWARETESSALEDEEVGQLLHSIDSNFYALPSFLFGLSGILATQELATEHHIDVTHWKNRNALKRQLLDCLVDTDNEQHALGQQLARVSTDFAFGTSGVLWYATRRFNHPLGYLPISPLNATELK